MIYGFQFFSGRSYCVGEYFGPQGSPALPILTRKMYFIFYPFRSRKAKDSHHLSSNTQRTYVFLKQSKNCFLRIAIKTFIVFFVFGHSTSFSDKGIICNISNVRKEGGGVGKNFWLRYSIHAKDLLLYKVEEYDQT